MTAHPSAGERGGRDGARRAEWGGVPIAAAILGMLAAAPQTEA